MVLADTALRLRALLDFEDEDGNKFVAGDEWLFEGPGEQGTHFKDTWGTSWGADGVLAPQGPTSPIRR